MERVLIKNLEENELSKISGMIKTIRNTKYMIFIKLKDRTGYIQVSVDKIKEELAEKCAALTTGSFVSFTGKIVMSEYVKDGGKEFLPDDVEVLSLAEAYPIEENALPDKKLDYRWIDLRCDAKEYIIPIQSAFVKYLRDYLYNQDFTEIHTPKIIGTASESGSSVFEVKYFNDKAYLAQSPQFYKQMAMASGFSRVFEVAPCFRAENSNTSKHATEFTSFDVEFSYINSFNDVMNLEAEMLTYALGKIKEEYGDKIEKIFGEKVEVPTLPFPTMPLKEVYAELEARYGYKVREEEKVDLTTEAERLCKKLARDKFNHEFLFITEYPAEKRAFYHMRDLNGVLQGYDLIWKGIEITTGAQREHRYEEICKNAKEKGLGEDVKFYLDFFKYGCPPHGGFAIGVDRLTMLLLNVPTIKEGMFIFRGPTRLNP